MVSRFGWKDVKGRLSFRHTISDRSDRFRVDAGANQILASIRIIFPFEWPANSRQQTISNRFRAWRFSLEPKMRIKLLGVRRMDQSRRYAP